MALELALQLDGEARQLVPKLERHLGRLRGHSVSLQEASLAQLPVRF